jgi:hypothetical protein
MEHVNSLTLFSYNWSTKTEDLDIEVWYNPEVNYNISMLYAEIFLLLILRQYILHSGSDVVFVFQFCVFFTGDLKFNAVSHRGKGVMTYVFKLRLLYLSLIIV